MVVISASGTTTQGIVPPVMDKTSNGLWCTTTDKETAELNPFPICKRNKKYNTKGSQIIPYSIRLK